MSARLLTRQSRRARSFVRRRSAPSGAGQALVEFVTVGGVVASLLIALVLTSRLQDLQWATIGASRYAAFDAALVGTPQPHAEQLLRARFFVRSAVPLRARAAPGPAAGERIHPEWTDHSLEARPLLRRSEDVTLRLRNASPAGTAASALAVIVGAADQVGQLTGARFDVERAGYVSATVGTELAPILSFAPLDAMRLRFVETATVLGRDWAASGPAQTEQRTAALVPAHALAAARPLLRPVTWALQIIEPAFGDLCLARIDVDRVPLDRLGPPGSADRGTWVARCR